ncbi:RIP metalloprotease RseP [Govanella unica]|uniref:Zinc metalloprotease n=1 Tax=Govanella unica TaxID=2975056 RepID=A0A9X3Z774_9PROT|nr:RIP metalloprotease RseP [Govania unica]MDA5193773.1 RIP metalloprotease RseP [Govania unica]
MESLLDLGHTLLTFVVVLTILVFVHEWGHYWVARRCGVRVDVFSIGFGPELFGWTDKSGTRWKVSLLPLGGYVKFFGDMNAASATDNHAVRAMSDADRKVAFPTQPVWKRAAIVAAGPIANFILAIAILAGFFMTMGQPYSPAVVGEVVPQSAAERAGIEVGDKVLRINGDKIDRFQDMQMIIQMHPGDKLSMLIDRGGQEKLLSVVPDAAEIKDPIGQPQKIGRLGVARSGDAFVERNPAEAVYYATIETGSIVKMTVNYIGQIITGKRSGEELGGPIRIAKYSSATARDGVVALIWFIAMLSINLGFVNLLPVPMLDGGHLVYYGWEALSGKPLSERAQEYGMRIGLALVLALMLFVTWNDLSYLKIFNF